jgi:hypothetical protein
MWEAFCQHLRECGRSGHLFGLIMLLIGAGAFFGSVGILVLLGLLAAYLIWFCVEIHQQRERFEQLGRQPPLAGVDLRSARIRLANSKTQRLQAEQAQRLKTQRMSGTGRMPNNPGAGPLRLRPR